jgi:preprotein translocase subunit SecG
MGMAVPFAAVAMAVSMVVVIMVVLVLVVVVRIIVHVGGGENLDGERGDSEIFRHADM